MTVGGRREKAQHNERRRRGVDQFDRKNPTKSPVHVDRDTLTDIDSHSQVQRPTYTQEARV